MLDHLRSAEALAQTLGDHLRLGQVYADHEHRILRRWAMSTVPSSLASVPWPLAATLGHVGLQARALLDLGQAYFDARETIRGPLRVSARNVATLQGRAAL